MRLSNKTAIVTGAATGIGYAIAQRFAQEGARVVILDIDRDGSESAARTIQVATGSEVLGLQADVTDEAAVENAMGQCGDVDILVSNAGIQIISSLDQLSYADWKRVISVHLDGSFLVTRACLRRMYAAGRGGSIIYTGSVHSKLASVLKGPYVAAKHGILGLCRAVAKEGAKHNVRANVICPGFVRTRLVDKQIPEQARILGISEDEVVSKVMLKDTVDGKFTTTDEIADTAVFFASAESLALTGQSLLLTHGWFME
jgi:3-hydroxybutyrate dehydrogenase